MTARQTSPAMTRWLSGGSVTAPDGSIQVRTVLPRRLPAGQHPGGLHGRVRVRRPGGWGVPQQDRGDQVFCRLLKLSLVHRLVVGPPAGGDRRGGYHQHEQDDQDQPQGGLDPVGAPAQRVAVQAEPSDEPGRLAV